MKMPGITFDKEAVGGFLLRHGEKFVVVAVGLAAVGLAWGGIQTVQTKSASAQQRPEEILRRAREAAGHIDREQALPAGEKRAGPPLATAIDPWRAPTVAEPPPLAPLLPPLFPEFAKRTQPAVFPIENLRAVAGLMVLPAKEEPAAVEPAAEEPAPAEKPKRPKRGRDSEPAAAEPVPDVAAPAEGPDARPRGRITPYVVVTGLIPYAKQAAEYDQRFAGVGYQDKNRDLPHWGDWRIERCVVDGGSEHWEPVDLLAAGRNWKAEWTGLAADDATAWRLSPDQDRHNPRTVPPYCGPLPQLLEGTWAVNGLHPWMLEQVRRKAEAAAAPVAPPDPGLAAGGLPGEPEPPPQPPVVGPAQPDADEYRMFRFIDTAVEQGRAYRYRVRFVVENPNFGLEFQHLADSALAKPQTLESPLSNATAPVTVPDPLTLLVEPLESERIKRFKFDDAALEVLVLAPSPRTGGYVLRALVTEPGGLLNVIEKLNKPQDPRTRGEEILTDRVLVDVRGRQEEAAKPRPGRRREEPLELLCLRPDGGCDVVSAADSQTTIATYAATLPADAGDRKSDKKPDKKDAGPGPVRSPFDIK